MKVVEMIESRASYAEFRAAQRRANRIDNLKGTLFVVFVVCLATLCMVAGAR